MKKKEKQRIGIWGLGTVGMSALRFFANQQCDVQLFDDRQLEPSEHAVIKSYDATPVPPEAREQFLNDNDLILASPGVDLRPYQHYKQKWITELDIIQKDFQKPIVAITGTVGKTTVAHLLSQLLASAGLRVWTGGNIGTGMLDLLGVEQEVDVAVLEVSSFQLEHCTSFAPTLAIVTNLYENHFDRHGTMKAYVAAKEKIFKQQTAGQHVLLPYTNRKKLKLLEKKENTFHFFTTKIFRGLKRGFFFIKNKRIMRHASPSTKPLPHNIQNIFQNICTLTYQENALVVALAARLISQILDCKLSCKLNNPTLPPHRLEYVATRDGVSFYNDSKSTATAPTIAAVQQLAKKPILLLLGGLSKGANRSPLIAAIKKKIRAVYAFGTEAKALQQACKQHSVPCQCFSTLDDAFDACTITAQSGDQVLLSPAGSSFDLFKNYEERGNKFKELIARLSA